MILVRMEFSAAAGKIEAVPKQGEKAIPLGVRARAHIEVEETGKGDPHHGLESDECTALLRYR